MSKPESAGRTNRVVSTIILIMIVVGGVMTASTDGPNLWEKLLAWIRQEFGMSLEELNATAEVGLLRESGVPDQAIFPYVQGRYANSNLYPVTDDSVVTVYVATPDYLEWTLKDASCGYYSGTSIRDLISDVEPLDQHGSAYVVVRLGSFPQSSYHQTFTVPSCTVRGTQAGIQRQIDWQPFSLTRRNVEFLFVSREEMDVLQKLRAMCQAKWCNIPSDWSSQAAVTN